MRALEALSYIKETKGKLEFNHSALAWFYSIPQQWKRAIVGQGETPEDAIEQAIRQLQDK